MTAYRYVGNHADTIYKDDLCIPVGAGDEVELSDDDLEANQHLMDSVVPIEEEAAAPAEEKTSASKSTKK